MSVTIRIAGIEATIQDGVWSCDDPPTLRVLQSNHDVGDGPEGSDPYPDLTAAKKAVQDLGGTVVRYDELPDGPPDLII